MQTLETVKTRSQTTFNNLLQKGKEQPEEVKTWGITAGGAVVGAIVVTAAAKGVLSVLATLAAPPVALTVGALGGGALGWNYLHNQRSAKPPEPTSSEAATADPAPLAPEATKEATQVSSEPLTAAATISQPTESTEKSTPTKSDKLEAITGIGPVYSSRLQAAGVHTFAQLAALTPERVHAIIGETRAGHMIEPERWIAEAGQLATGGKN